MEEKIKAEAKRLGFGLCGIALAETAEGFAAYQDWVNKGLYAEMGYLARPDAIAKRKDISLLLPACKSVVCVGLPYPKPVSSQTHAAHDGGKNQICGKIAAYAQLEDYHTVLREKLESLGLYLDQVLGRAVGRVIAVDSSPVLEKDFSIKAGLGQRGKNTLVRNDRFGTWFFMGELLLDLDLKPDMPLEGDFCGDCDLCVRACPTGALRGDGTMDAGRCLSYLTIEHRGAIPESYRKALGNRVFGCDICQLACPKNTQALPEGYCFQVKPILDAQIDIPEALKLSETAFKQRYKGTLILRAKYSGFRRNLILTLGNGATPEAAQLIEQLLNDEEDPLFKESARWALGALKDRFQG